MKAQKGLEGAHEMVVLSVGERPENALRRLADVELAHRGRDVRARTNDTRARRERGEREPQTRRRLGVDRRERNRQIRACPARCSVSFDNEEGLPVREAFLEVRLSESR